MHAAFRRGGRAAINKVMKTQPAAFLKLLVLLVPREMKIEHSGASAMTDEQVEAGLLLLAAWIAVSTSDTQPARSLLTFCLS